MFFKSIKKLLEIFKNITGEGWVKKRKTKIIDHDSLLRYNNQFYCWKVTTIARELWLKKGNYINRILNKSSYTLCILFDKQLGDTLKIKITCFHYKLIYSLFYFYISEGRQQL